jgi:hypothetical protein
MSTKIYNGIKFNSKNFKEILDQIVSIKPKAIDIAVEKLRKSLPNFIKYNNLIDKDEYEISIVLTDSLSTSSDKCFIPRVSFTIFFYPTKEGDVYGYFFDSNVSEYSKLLDPFCTDFHYQNQSDKPDDISEEEWDFRSDKWDELVDYNFRDSGFMYEVVSKDDIGAQMISKIREILEPLKRDIKIESLGISDKKEELNGSK